MKGIPIKFRGVSKDGTRYTLTVPKKIEGDEICQLLGYDVEGNEIYEGDEIENTDLLAGKTFCVKAEYCGINYAHFNFKLAGGNDE